MVGDGCVCTQCHVGRRRNGNTVHMLSRLLALAQEGMHKPREADAQIGNAM